MMRDDEIFEEAIALPKEERAALLDRACAGDAAMRARIEALLAGHDAAENFLEHSPAERPAPLPEEKLGDALGAYTLIKKIGEGGYGVVYLADQQHPVRRHVALKVIKLGMDTRQVIARFEAERQALAMMEHPDIARVFDAGATETGRPFFVMEFVDGVPITKFCDEHGLTVAARLELFARVCLALQHAHQKGIIHRDLKPSNILVSMRDGVPTPKIIDFGIAKATQGRLTDLTLATAVEQFIGTPAYMSPEQAELRDLDIDTRSDIYSLGVLLYELLAGRLPYDPQSLVRAGIQEIRRIIREVEPARPSTRVSTLDGADRETIAQLRGVAPMRLTAVLRGDLDWIVMRCLEKDRERRYGTAHELAEDVRRHLRSEPVTARPPSVAYRAQKFVARNRLVCASAAAVLASLVLGTIVSVRQAIRARQAEGVALVARDDAQRRQEQAEALLAFMLGDFRTELKKLGRLNLLDAVGDRAVAYFVSLNPRDLTDTALTRQSEALTQIGQTRLDQARYAEAATAFDTAYKRAAALAARHPQDADIVFERAQAEYWIGFTARRRGDLNTAQQWFTRYRDSAVALVAIEGEKLRAQRELTSSHHNLAVVEMDRGNLAAARLGFLAEVVAVEKMLLATPNDLTLRFRLADIASWLGMVAEYQGDFPEALARFSEMTRRVEALVALEPTVPRWQFKVAESLISTAGIMAITGRRDEADTAYMRAQALLDELIKQDAENQFWLSSTQNLRLLRAALALANPARVAGAVPLLDEARQRLEVLAAAEPATNAAFTGRLAFAWQLEARRRFALNQPDARAAAARAIELGDKLVAGQRANDRAIAELASACVLAGRIAQAQGQTDAARQLWQRTLTLTTAQATHASDWRFLDPTAQAHVLLGQPELARPLIERLQRFGYRPIDPLAASLLDAAR